MAPPNGTSKPRNGAAGRPLANRPVPAIPLTYTTRRLKPGPTKLSPLPQTTTNGSALKNRTDSDITTDVAAEPTEDGVAEVKRASENPASHGTNGELGPAESPITPESVDSEAADSVQASTPADPIVEHHREETFIEDKPNAALASLEQVGQQDSPPTASATVRLHPPIVSPTRHQMPPAFQPAPRPVSLITNGDANRGSRPVLGGPPNMHHPHPSNGSLQFGGFGSNNSSPAPPHSGGFAPPPGMPLHDGRRPFYGHTGSGNGFPPPMPYGTEFVPVTGLDSYGRPMPGPAGIDSYPPYMNTYGPSTPHSFHGSHSSAQAEENGAYTQFPSGGGMNGATAQDDHRSKQQPQQPATRVFGGLPPQRMMHAPMPPPQMMHQIPDGQASDGLAAYTQAQFRDTTFADCTLELRYLDDRAPPVRIPGHRMILARSAPLRAILESGAGISEAGPHGQAMRTVLLQSDDKYVRSDAFWMAVQRIYAFPLLAIPKPDGSLNLAGSTADRFDFALGYAASGHLLGWGSVVVRGLEIATHLLSWTTVEKALGFALGDVPGRGSADRHTHFIYGEPVQILMNGIISFIINNFPPAFSLDTSVETPPNYSRLPALPAAPPASKSNGPPIARGTSVHLGQGRRPRPMHIKFGDLSPSSAASEGNNPASDANQLTPQQRTVQSTLSRVLLNLPFAFLKPTLESSSYGNVAGWANTEARHQIIREVVAEREARRQAAVEAVRAGNVPDVDSIRRTLLSVEPRMNDEWHILGWQEEVLSYGMADTPSLSRKWVPTMGAASHSQHQSVDFSSEAYP